MNKKHIVFIPTPEGNNDMFDMYKRKDNSLVKRFVKFILTFIDKVKEVLKNE